MTVDGKLVIGIVTRTMETSNDVLNVLRTMETKNGTTELDTGRGILFTKDAFYQIIDKNKAHGFRVDQIIIDFACYDPEICDPLLMRSCVPYDYHLIDYEDILKNK